VNQNFLKTWEYLGSFVPGEFVWLQPLRLLVFRFSSRVSLVPSRFFYEGLVAFGGSIEVGAGFCLLGSVLT